MLVAIFPGYFSNSIFCRCSYRQTPRYVALYQSFNWLRFFFFQPWMETMFLSSTPDLLESINKFMGGNSRHLEPECTYCEIWFNSLHWNKGVTEINGPNMSIRALNVIRIKLHCVPHKYEQPRLFILLYSEMKTQI